MTLADCEEITGTLAIDGISMHTAAWNAGNLLELWLGGDLKGRNLDVGPVTGERPYPRRFTTTRHSLDFAVVGHRDRLGAPYTNFWSGLELNLTYLRTNVLDPVASATGTRLAVLTLPSGQQRSGPIHVLGFTPDRRPSEGIDTVSGEPTVAVFGKLNIELPYGVLTVGGS